MQRRDLMTLVKTFEALKVPGSMSMVSAVSAPVLAILETEQEMNPEQVKAISNGFNKAIKTLHPPFDKVKFIVLGQRAQLTFFNEAGEICNMEFIRELSRGYRVKQHQPKSLRGHEKRRR
jgi:hypothetical protein